MNLLGMTEVAGLVIALGGAGAVIQKGVRGLRRLGRLLDGFLGDGTAKHPSVPDRLAALELQVTAMGQKIDAHVDRDAPGLLADGQAWGRRLDASVEDLHSRVAALEKRNTPTG